MTPHDKKKFYESLNPVEQRIQVKLRNRVGQCWSDLWGESIPKVSEYCDVAIDLVYDLLTNEERETWNQTNNFRKRLIARSTF